MVQRLFLSARTVRALLVFKMQVASALERSLQVPARVLRGPVTDDENGALLTAAVLVAVRGPWMGQV